MQHELYTDQDIDRPESICDQNGDVVLALCKRCGKAEVDLNQPCISRTMKTTKQFQSPLIPETISIKQAEDEAYRVGFRVGFIVCLFFALLFMGVGYLILDSIYHF
jgi:hypothetical protein